MLKKAGVIAAAAAGLMMLSAPAFADIDSDENNQIGLINLNDIDIAKDINANVIAGICNNNIGVLAVVLPILSPQATESCAAGGIVD